MTIPNNRAVRAAKFATAVLIAVDVLILFVIPVSSGWLRWTVYKFDAASVNDIDAARLLPGDLAITADGVHAMVYLGDNEWIEADPDSRRVVRVRAPVTDIVWFNVPVAIVRWAILDV